MHPKAESSRPARAVLPILLVVVASVPAAAAKGRRAVDEQVQTTAPPPAAAPAGTPYYVPRASGDITIDGVLDETAWDDALVVTLDYETRPAENAKPPVETEALVTYSDSSLYVGFRAYDDDPEAIRAYLSDRDRAFSDDFVGIVVDTFNDERRAFEFFVNPLGVQMDLFNDDVGRNETSSWDAIWNSAGKITDEGYFVELAVPFHQLRFPATKGEQVWGVDFVRFWPRNQRRRIASQPMDRDRDCYLCQISKMRGFEGVSPGRNLEIVPTVTAGQTDERTDFPEGPLESGSVDSDIGLNVRWGVTPNLTLNGTVNPDFSQVEADVARLDINTTFTLFFPERRPFFLEGADFFDTSFNAVFTRNVSDPDWGLKASGKQGKNAYGVFVAEDAVTNLIFPGSQSSDSESFDFASTDAVVRYRRDFGSNSAIGVLMTSRDGGGYNNTVGGIDGLYRMGQSDSIEFQYLSSQTEYPFDLAQEFEQPLDSFSDDAFRMVYRHDARNWEWWGYYEDIGEHFRADMGFMPQVGVEEGGAGFSHTWWGDEDDWYTRFNFGSEYEERIEHTGDPILKELDAWGSVGGPKQSYLFVRVADVERRFEGKTFSRDSINTWMEIQPNKTVWLGLYAWKGDRVDFANAEQGDGFILEPSVRLNLGKRLRLNLEHTLNRLDREEGQLFEANLTQLRAVYQINIRSFVRAIVQYTAIDRDPSLYDEDEDVDAESEDLFTQLLFSYKINPQTALFLGYTDSREGDENVSLLQSGRSIFFKVGYAWNL